MEKFKDILSNVKERISNPLVFSFLCSWLIINWRITIGLLWYDPNQLEKSGSPTIFDFIAKNTTTLKSVIYPLIFAVAYTLLMPIVRNLVRALYTWAGKWGENWNLKILKGGQISIEKYLRLREDHDNRTALLQSIIKKENEFANEFDKVNTLLLQTQVNENDLRQQVAELNGFIARSRDVRTLNGYWSVRFADTVTMDFKGTEEIFIDDGRYFILKGFAEKTHVFTITHFYFDSVQQTVFFIKDIVNQEKAVVMKETIPYLKFSPNVLKFERSDLLVGVENGTTQIQYQKKQQRRQFIESISD